MKILVGGIGNIFLGDDGFGPAVVRRLAERGLPDGVKLVDFGIRSFDLVYALLEEWDATVLIDAVPKKHAPGTLYVIEPTVAAEEGAQVAIETHTMDPAHVLALAQAMGGRPRCVRLVGCEPATLEPNGELLDGLSPEVAAAVEPAASLVVTLLRELGAPLTSRPTEETATDA